MPKRRTQKQLLKEAAKTLMDYGFISEFEYHSFLMRFDINSSALWKYRTRLLESGLNNDFDVMAKYDELLKEIKSE